jgi:hypothetical protein
MAQDLNNKENFIVNTQLENADLLKRIKDIDLAIEGYKH